MSDCPLAALAAAATRSENPDAPAATAEPHLQPFTAGGGQPMKPHGQASQARPQAAEVVDDPLLSACWGAQLRGDASMCTPGFLGGTAHFKASFSPAF